MDSLQLQSKCTKSGSEEEIGMFGIFKKQAVAKAPSWSSLKPEQKAVVAHKIASVYKNMARYKIVSGFD